MKLYYFIGIKGSGMASLARVLYDLGYEVSGSDIDKYIFTEEDLRQKNIPIYSFDAHNIKDGYHVIIGNSFDKEHVEVKAAIDNPTVTCYRYVDFLGELMNRYESIAIAGTHGKTTTTGMAYHLFNEYKKTSVLMGMELDLQVQIVIILLQKRVNIRIIFYIIILNML